MVHWLTHFYGPRNRFKLCPSCGDEIDVEELKVYSGVCRNCLNKVEKKNKSKSLADNKRKDN